MTLQNTVKRVSAGCSWLSVRPNVEFLWRCEYILGCTKGWRLLASEERICFIGCSNTEVRSCCIKFCTLQRKLVSVAIRCKWSSSLLHEFGQSAREVGFCCKKLVPFQGKWHRFLLFNCFLCLLTRIKLKLRIILLLPYYYSVSIKCLLVVMLCYRNSILLKSS